MKTSISKILMLLFPLCAVFSICHGSDLSGDVKRKFPDSQIVAEKSCNLGEKGTSALGFVRYRAGADGAGTEFKAQVAIAGAAGTEILDVPSDIDVPGLGLVRNFLSMFLTDGEYVPGPDPYRIKCTHPKQDEDISEELGKYLLDKQSNAKLLASKHLCFQADSVYNNWICFVYDESKKSLEQSFAQLLAD